MHIIILETAAKAGRRAASADLREVGQGNGHGVQEARVDEEKWQSKGEPESDQDSILYYVVYVYVCI